MLYSNNCGKSSLENLIKISSVVDTPNSFRKKSSNPKIKTTISKKKSINKLSIKSLMNKEINTKSINFSEAHSRNRNILNINNSTQFLNFKPKRLIKITGYSEIPLKNIGGKMMKYSSLFSPIKKDKDNEIKQEISTSLSDAEFRSVYLLKTSKISDNFEKYEINKELFNGNNKYKFIEIFKQISKFLEKQAKTCFNFDDIYNNNNNKLNFNNTSSDNNNNFTNMCLTNRNTVSINSCFDTNTNYNENNNNILAKTKEYIISWNNYNALLDKFFHILFNELRDCKNENLKVTKKINEIEYKYSKIIKKFEFAQSRLCKFESASKLKNVFKEKIDQLQYNFQQKENKYVIKVYNLENEIKNLVTLLDKAKDYFNKYIESKKEIENQNEKIYLLRNEFNKELKNANLDVVLQKDAIDELNEKIKKNELQIEKYKTLQDKNKQVEIERTTHQKKLEMIINEKEENICMLNEELEWFIREYNKEKNDHNNTKNELRLVENRYYNEKKNIVKNN